MIPQPDKDSLDSVPDNGFGSLLSSKLSEGWEPEAAAARRFDETGATKYSLMSHDLVVRQQNI